MGSSPPPATRIKFLNMKILGLLAKKQNGKGTVSDYIIKNHEFKQYAFADPGKRGLQEMFGFTDEQLWGSEEEKEKIDPRWGISARRTMQIVLTDLFQFDIQKHLKPEEFKFKDLGRKIWVHKFKLWFEEQEKQHKINFIEAKIAGLVNGEIPEFKIVINDIRFQHECDIVMEMGGEIWRIIRPNKENNDNHKSEIEQDTIITDKTIVNDGTLQDLYSKIESNLLNHEN